MPDETPKNDASQKPASGGALSQEEINAMLSGIEDDTPEPSAPEPIVSADVPAPAPVASSAANGPEVALTQEEINAMLAGISDEPELPAKPKAVTESNAVGLLSPKDRLAAGELVNLAFSASAASLSAQLGVAVESDLPQVREFNALDQGWAMPFAGTPSFMLMVNYGKKETDSTLLLIPIADIRTLIQRLAPGTPASGAGEELNDAENKVFSQVANGLCNAVSSSLTAMLPDKVNLAPPDILIYSPDMLPVVMPSLEQEAFIGVDLTLHFPANETVTIHQLWPSAEVKTQVDRLMTGKIKPMPPVEVSPAVMATGTLAPAMAMAGAAQAGGPPVMQAAYGNGGGYSPPPINPHQPYLNTGYASPPTGPISVQPVQFTAFDQQPSLYANPNTNLDLVMDITLNLTVELGKTEISIKDVLELTRGSVIELDRIAGEPVDLLANGKLIAKGEVVVIEDSFGLRITSIVSPAERLRSI